VLRTKGSFKRVVFLGDFHPREFAEKNEWLHIGFVLDGDECKHSYTNVNHIFKKTFLPKGIDIDIPIWTVGVMNDIQEKSVEEMLTEAGFTIHKGLTEGESLFATIDAEPYSVKPNHFEPRNRTLYVSGPMHAHGTFYYATSCINGRWRGHRCKNWIENADVGNIFGSGRTQHAAVVQFLENFKAKTYNRSSHM
jgi:hypothetical protein